MKNIFVDTNILVDLIADRKPYSKYAVEIFNKSNTHKYKIYTSSHSIATTHYLLKKYIDEKKLRMILFDLTTILFVLGVDNEIIKKSLKSSHKDFEDAIQINTAYTILKMDCIITRNIKDYKTAEIPVYSPDDFLKL